MLTVTIAWLWNAHLNSISALCINCRSNSSSSSVDIPPVLLSISLLVSLSLALQILDTSSRKGRLLQDAILNFRASPLTQDSQPFRCRHATLLPTTAVGEERCVTKLLTVVSLVQFRLQRLPRSMKILRVLIFADWPRSAKISSAEKKNAAKTNSLQSN